MTRSVFVGIALGAIFTCLAGPAAADWQSVQKQGETSYQLFLPEGCKPKAETTDGREYPLVMVLHSVGWRAKGINAMKQVLPAKVLTGAKMQAKHPAIVMVPHCPPPKQWVDLKWKHGSYSVEKVKISGPMQDVFGAVKAIRAMYPVDATRLYVVGGSMGGYGTWDMLCRKPEMWAAAVPIAGAGDPSKGKELREIGIWAWHGEKDRVIPPSGTKDMIRAIEAAGGKPKTTYLPMGHLWDQAWKKQPDEVAEWLFSHKRKPEPATQPKTKPEGSKAETKATRKADS